MEIDLQLLCDRSRPNIATPWSAGDWSYACDGKVAVRVPRRANVAERDDAPTGSVFIWFTPLTPGELLPLPRVEVPEPVWRTCRDCDGRGCEHDCPECGCECGSCGGVGKLANQVVMATGGFDLSGRTWRVLQALPDVRLAAGITKYGHIRFTFAGGDGLASPLRVREARAVVVEAHWDDQAAQPAQLR
jgi:hypothetical protein